MPAETEDERAAVDEMLERAAVLAESGDTVLSISVPVPEERIAALASEVGVAIRSLKSSP